MLPVSICTHGKPNMDKLHGAIILPEDDESHDVLTIITTSVRETVEYTYFSQPLDFDWDHQFDFVIVNTAANLKAIIKLYEHHGSILPHFILFIQQDDVETLQASRAYRSPIEITRVFQSELDGRSTLKFDSFYQIISKLQKLKHSL